MTPQPSPRCPTCSSYIREWRGLLGHPTEDARCFDPWHSTPEAEEKPRPIQEDTKKQFWDKRAAGETQVGAPQPSKYEDPATCGSSEHGCCDYCAGTQGNPGLGPFKNGDLCADRFHGEIKTEVGAQPPADPDPEFTALEMAKRLANVGGLDRWVTMLQEWRNSWRASSPAPSQNNHFKALKWINERVDEGRGMVEFGNTEEGDIGVWIYNQPNCAGRGYSVTEAIEVAMSKQSSAGAPTGEGAQNGDDSKISGHDARSLNIGLSSVGDDIQRDRNSSTALDGRPDPAVVPSEELRAKSFHAAWGGPNGHGQVVKLEDALEYAASSNAKLQQALAERINLVPDSYPCSKCGVICGMDCVVPHHIWNRIEAETGYNILCPWCLDKECLARGIKIRAMLVFCGQAINAGTDPPEANDLHWETHIGNMNTKAYELNERVSTLEGELQRERAKHSETRELMLQVAGEDQKAINAVRGELREARQENERWMETVKVNVEKCAEAEARVPSLEAELRVSLAYFEACRISEPEGENVWYTHITRLKEALRA